MAQSSEPQTAEQTGLYKQAEQQTDLYGVSFTDVNTGTAVGTYGTILRTTNGGTTWTSQKWNKIRFNMVSPLPMQITGRLLVIMGSILRTTNGGGLTFVNQISSEIPERFSLYQNYPNPFNPTTNIKFDIQKTSATKLIVYDALGREVATLVNEKLKAGSYQVDWDGSNYTSGVYFYKLTAGDFVEVKKMLLVK